jgi:predicted nucleotidyltransferase
VARGDNTETSDLDILVELDESARLTVFDYVGLKRDIAAMFEGPVDVVDRDALKAHLRTPLARDLLYAF